MRSYQSSQSGGRAVEDAAGCRNGFRAILAAAEHPAEQTARRRLDIHLDDVDDLARRCSVAWCGRPKAGFSIAVVEIFQDRNRLRDPAVGTLEYRDLAHRVHDKEGVVPPGPGNHDVMRQILLDQSRPRDV